jgi:hypothetical protein
MMSTAPTLTARPRALSRLTPTDEELLLTCARYHYVTVDQWLRSFADEGKRRYVQRRSRELVAQDYLIRLYISRPGGQGKAPSIFTLGLAGRRHVESLGIRVPQRFRRSDLFSLSPKHLAHSEDVTDVLLNFDLLVRHDGRIEIAEMLHERFLFEQRFKVPVRMVHLVTGEVRQEPMEVTPDAFVKVSAWVEGEQKRRVFPILVEVDRDTEQQVVFREKIAKLYAFGTSETYEQVYGARSFNVAFFVQAPRRDPLQRLAELLAWTERELKQRQLTHDAVSFSYCALDPAATPPEVLLLGASWFYPFSTTPHSLIDLSEASEGGV